MNLNALAARCARRASGFALIESPDCYPAPSPAHLVRRPDDVAPTRRAARLTLPLPYQHTQTLWRPAGRVLQAVPVFVRRRRSI